MPAGRPGKFDGMKGDTSGLPYRPCAGIMLINCDGLVWIGERLPKWDGDQSAHVWQMPQGGIDEAEDPQSAAVRELEEETGVASAEVLAATRDWLCYDLPADLIGSALKGKYRGQKQMWYAMRFLGDDTEIDISERAGDKAEFLSWRWEQADRLPGLIVPFKRAIYEAVIEEFAEFLA